MTSWNNLKEQLAFSERPERPSSLSLTKHPGSLRHDSAKPTILIVENELEMAPMVATLEEFGFVGPCQTILVPIVQQPKVTFAAPRILAVEDEALLARGQVELLMEHGYDVPGFARKGEKALEMASENHFDLALVDIRLAGRIDGIEVARILRDQFETPSIFVTAFDDSETVRMAMDTDPLGFLNKPVNDDALSSSVAHALRRIRDQRRVRLIEKARESTQALTHEEREDLKNLQEEADREVNEHQDDRGGLIRSSFLVES